MAAGKNKVAHSFRLEWDDASGTVRDLSTDVVPGSVTGGGLTLDSIDAGGISEAVKKMMAGRASAPVSARLYMNDTASTGATTVVNATVGKIGTLTLKWGSNGAAPGSGDPKWSGEYILLQNPVSEQNGTFAHDCRWEPAAGAADPGWGTI